MGEAARSLLRTTSSRHKPWQVALAIALGMCCGLVPKANLTFMLMAGVCYVLPIHLPLAIVACLLTSLVAPSMEASLGQLGLWSLRQPHLREFWLRLDGFPLVPWFALHNSIVHGSLLFGTAFLIPLHYMLLPFARWIAPKELAGLARHETLNFTQEPVPKISLPAQPEHPASDESPVSEGMSVESYAAAVNHAPDPRALQQLEALLGTCTEESAADLSSDEILLRAAEMAEFVDQLLSECSEDWGPLQVNPKQPAPPRKGCHAIEERHARESPLREHPTLEATIESVADALSDLLTNRSDGQDWKAGEPQRETFRRLDALMLNQPSPHHKQATTTTEESTHGDEKDCPQLDPNTSNKFSPTHAAQAQSPASTQSVVPPVQARQTLSSLKEHREETLRFLLQHLKAINDKV